MGLIYAFTNYDQTKFYVLGKFIQLKVCFFNFLQIKVSLS